MLSSVCSPVFLVRSTDALNLKKSYLYLGRSTVNFMLEAPSWGLKPRRTLRPKPADAGYNETGDISKWVGYY